MLINCIVALIWFSVVKAEEPFIVHMPVPVRIVGSTPDHAPKHYVGGVRSDDIPYERRGAHSHETYSPAADGMESYGMPDMYSNWQPTPYVAPVYIPSQEYLTYKEAAKGLKSQIATRNELRQKIKEMDQFETRSRVLDEATKSIVETKEYLGRDQFEEAEISARISHTLLDLTTSLTPGVSWARDVYEALSGKDLHSGETLDAFARSVAILGVISGGFGSKAVKAMQVIEKTTKVGLGGAPHLASLMARRLSGSAEKVAKSATELRKSPGVSVISAPLHNSDTLLRGTHANAGLVPKEIGEQLVGKQFSNFDAFKKKYWKLMAESKYAKNFDERDLLEMRKGNAPFAVESQSVGKNVKYELHHIEPINQGGHVYDVSNIMMVTPRFHQEALIEGYHYAR